VSAELPLYTFRNSSSGELLKTRDPGRALVTGRWSDMNRTKVPSLRALAGRAPYFHNGIAPTLEAAIDHHDQRFHIGFSRDQVAALGFPQRTLMDSLCTNRKPRGDWTQVLLEPASQERGLDVEPGVLG
jgi:hypothetical protein